MAEVVKDKRFGNFDNRKPVEIDGKKFKSRKEACRHYKVYTQTFQARKRRGLTIEQCLGLEKVADNRYSSGRRV